MSLDCNVARHQKANRCELDGKRWNTVAPKPVPVRLRLPQPIFRGDTMNHGPRRRISELDWRPDRIEHIARHSITPEEVEEAVFGDAGGVLLRGAPAERNPDETIYRYFGRSEAGRHVMVVLLYVEFGIAMPITAREMTRAEHRRFNDRRPPSR